MQQPPKKIVIVGPESTGKSTLCQLLATHYQTLWCPEYARQYLLEHGTHYSFDDLLTIAKGQLALEDAFLKSTSELAQPTNKDSLSSYNQELSTTIGGKRKEAAGRLLFLDTDMYVMKVWCEFVFGQCHQFILNQIVERPYHLYLLCKPDLPWVKDELREYPDLENREKLYHIYKDLLINQSTPWVEISGGYEQRLATAIKAVNTLL